MSYFTQDPLIPILLCAVAAALLAFRWHATSRGGYLGGAVAVLLAAVAIYFFEQQYITPAEQIEAHLHDMAVAVVNDDAERALSYFSPQAAREKIAVGGAMAIYEIDDDLRITDVNVEMRSQQTLGYCHFRANGTISHKMSGISGHGATRWMYIWRLEAGEWKIIEMQRWHLVRDEQIEFLSQPGP